MDRKTDIRKSRLCWGIITLSVLSMALSEICIKEKKLNSGEIAFLSIPHFSDDFNNGIALLKYEINKEKVHCGDSVCIIWHWKCRGNIGDRCSIWIYFSDRWGNILY